MKNIDRYRISWNFPHKPIQWMMSALWIFTSSMDFWMGLNGYISSYSQSIERSLRICPSSSSIPCWSSSKVMSPGQENGPCYGYIGTVHLFWSPPNINILNTSELVYIYTVQAVAAQKCPSDWDFLEGTGQLKRWPFHGDLNLRTPFSILNLSDLSVGCSEASDHNWPQLHATCCLYELMTLHNKKSKNSKKKNQNPKHTTTAINRS